MVGFLLLSDQPLLLVMKKACQSGEMVGRFIIFNKKIIYSGRLFFLVTGERKGTAGGYNPVGQDKSDYSGHYGQSEKYRRMGALIMSAALDGKGEMSVLCRCPKGFF